MAKNNNVNCPLSDYQHPTKQLTSPESKTRQKCLRIRVPCLLENVRRIIRDYVYAAELLHEHDDEGGE